MPSPIANQGASIMAYAAELEISVILYEDDGVWIAQGIEFDVVARGSNPADAAKRFDAKMGAELVMSLELGDKRPLAGVGPAPKKFWRMFMNTRENMSHERTPLRILDDGFIPSYRPRMRIGELAMA
jgi:predicted RNA-binding protein (virulence factor B family)